jgi:hypothetical protein
VIVIKRSPLVTLCGRLAKRFAAPRMVEMSVMVDECGDNKTHKRQSRKSMKK